MAFRPVSVTSTFHKRLATAMGKQHSKQQKVRHVVTVVDPKRAKEEREKAEEERIRGRESLFKRQVSLLLDNVATGLTTYPVLVRTLHAYTST